MISSRMVMPWQVEHACGIMFEYRNWIFVALSNPYMRRYIILLFKIFWSHHDSVLFWTGIWLLHGFVEYNLYPHHIFSTRFKSSFHLYYGEIELSCCKDLNWVRQLLACSINSNYHYNNPIQSEWVGSQRHSLLPDWWRLLLRGLS